jgi:pimeloyl-ACP methyl ester carboxylesterase
MKHSDVIILHGWNLSGDKFAPLSDVLTERGYKVWAPDMPGFGKEPSPTKAWHVVDYAEFIQEYINIHHIKNPILIGHSFGGRVALKVAHLYPASAYALVLSGTPGFSPVPSKKLFFFIILAKIGRVIFAIPPLDLFSDWAKRWLYYIAGAKEFFRAEGVMKQTFKNVVADDLVTAMESIHIPTLLLWGEYDVMVPIRIAHRMKEVIAESKLNVIPEADHGVPFKQPELFVQYMEQFITSYV